MQASTPWSPSPAVAVLRRAVGLVGLAVLRRAVGLVGLAALRRVGPVGLVGLAALRRVGPVDRPRVDQVARPRDGLTVLPSVESKRS